MESPPPAPLQAAAADALMATPAAELDAATVARPVVAEADGAAAAAGGGEPNKPSEWTEIVRRAPSGRMRQASLEPGATEAERPRSRSR